MKKLVTLAIVLFFVFITVISVFADQMPMKSVDTILAEIRLEQGVQTTDKINPDKVKQAKLEELGDSVMEAMIGNTEVHDKMDIQLGGDGSASLTAFHVRLGYNYLSDYPNGMMTLMTSGMMGSKGGGNGSTGLVGMMGRNGYNNYNGNNGMMGSWGWGGVITGAIALILLIVILFFVFKTLARKPIGSSSDTALDILRKRYAKGELTQEEYKSMLDHLKK